MVCTSRRADVATTRTEDSIISLREYVDIRFEAQEKATATALSNADRAVTKAETATEKRFESVNEFRAALADSARDLMPRQEAERALKVLEDKYGVLERRVNNSESRTGGATDSWVRLGLAISIAVNLALVFVYLTKGH